MPICKLVVQSWQHDTYQPPIPTGNIATDIVANGLSVGHPLLSNTDNRQT